MKLGLHLGLSYFSTILAVIGVTWANNLLGSTDTNQIIPLIATPGGTTVVTNVLEFAASGAATTGILRFPASTTQAMTRKTADGSTTISVITFGASDTLTFGSSTGVTSLNGSALSMQAGGVEKATVTSSGLTIGAMTTGRVVMTTTGGLLTDAATVPFVNLATITSVNGTTVGAGGALTTDHVLKVTGAGASDWGAFNPAVMTIASQAIGDILYASSTTAWARLGTSTVGKALIAGGAGQPPSWGTDFGANNLVTTGVGSFGTTPATAGELRLPNNGNGVQFRNAANSANQKALSMDSGNTVHLSGGSAGTTVESSGNTLVCGSVIFLNTSNGTNGLIVVPVASTSVTVKPASDCAVTFTQDTRGSDLACKDYNFLTQAPFATATGTNRKPGDIIFGTPAPTNSGTTYGRVVLQGGTSDVLVTDKDSSGGVRLRINTATQSTVGAAGGASALPGTPTGYTKINIGGTDFVVPYYAVS